jgi:predicted ribosome quality control (RQC) complex YloA/Tae2 family protein
MDAVTLDHVLSELGPRLRGRHLSRPRIVAAHAVAFEVRGKGEQRLWLDAARGTAGVYFLARDKVRRLEGDGDSLPGRTRQAALLLRKHMDGARLVALRRVAGERTVVVETSAARLVLRLSGVAPALSLVVDEAVVATMGEGRDAWPLGPDMPARDWDRVDPAELESAAAAARLSDRSLTRALLAVCPGLGPVLARQLDGSAQSFVALRTRLSSPVPTVVAPALFASWHDADLVAVESVRLLPFAPAGAGFVLQPPTWLEAAALYLEGRRRGSLFGQRRDAALRACRARLRRLTTLLANLTRDGAGLPAAGELRRDAEALLAFPGALPPGALSADVPDPYEIGRVRSLVIDPALSAPGNADRLFERARRIERAQKQIALRLAESRAALAAEREAERRLGDARDLADLGGVAADNRRRPPGEQVPGRGPDPTRTGPRHYLTSRGLSVLVGRGAKENHHLTFTVARPDDLWLHARGVPGGHVVLRDPGGRAGADDLREAAEVAAFFSDARAEVRVDVHVARRKHLRSTRGKPGRVAILHAETLRVAPLDPEGRLRKG